MKAITKLVAFALVAALAFVLVGCGGSTSNDTSGGDDTKTYVIATDTTFAPFEFQNEDGDFVGIDIDLINAIAEDQGFTVEINSLGFDAALQALTSGQADAVIAGMSITEEREATFDFSDPYFDSGVVMGISADNDDIKGYSDLKGEMVAVKNGTEGAAFAESIAEQYGFNLVYFKDSAMMYEDVLAGNSVACFEDYPVMGYAITQGIGMQIVTDKEQGSSYGLAVLNDENAELIEMFNAGLANLKASGKYQEILDSYIQE